MVNKILAIIFIQLLSLSLVAQQEAIYSIYWNNYSSFNPATAGEQSKYYSAINLRDQWAGLEGHPRDANALFEYRIDTINSAVGINYTYSQLGIEKFNKIALNYSFHINLPKNRKIGIGIAPSYSTRKTDNTKFIAIDDFTQDPAIPNNAETTFNYFDLNAGISYISKKLRVGISSSQILESGGSSQGTYTNTRHYYSSVAYNVFFDSKFKLTPQARIALDRASSIYEFGLLATYNDRYWLGGSFRSEIALVAMAGIDIAKKFRIGYVYDYYRSDVFNTNFGGGHEIVLAVILN